MIDEVVDLEHIRRRFFTYDVTISYRNDVENSFKSWCNSNGFKCTRNISILQGMLLPGNELTNEFNVLEAGIWNAISSNKGRKVDKLHEKRPFERGQCWWDSGGSSLSCTPTPIGVVRF